MSRNKLTLLALALSASTLAFAASTTVETVNLNDLSLLKASVTDGFALKPGKTVNGRVPSFGGEPQTNAFGSMSNFQLTCDLKGQAHRLKGRVGIDDGMAKRFTERVEVLVYGDYKKLWASGPLKSGQSPVSMDIDLKGVKQLELLTDFSGDQIRDSHVTYSGLTISYSGARPETIWNGRTAKPVLAPRFITPKGPETPRITGGRVFGVRPGSPFLFTVTASGRKPMTFSAKNLPDGLQLDAQTGQISGYLKTKAEHRVLISAQNELGAAERELKIVVGDQLSLSPPMGWSSWNVWLTKVDQSKVEKAAELMVSLGLKDHGYLYVNIDDGWQGARGGKDNALQANDKFPDMKGLCDKIHKLGLKAGIYSTPWMTSYGKFPGSTAATPDGTWSKDKIEFKIGPCTFLKQDAKQFAEWGMDYCKWDWHFHKPEEIIAVADALKKSGRDIHCNLSNTGVFEHAPTYVKNANSWRTACDLLSHWVFLATIGFAQNQWADFGGPGHWLDMDMLIVGFAWGKPTNLTPDEQYLQMSMWSLMSAQLLMSCDLEKIDDFTLRLLTNDEVLDIDQDPLGKAAHRVLARGPLDVWVKDLEDGSKAIGFFNRSREPLEMIIQFKDLRLGEKYQVRDLWRRADLGTAEGQITVNPAPHGVQFYKITPMK